MKVFLGVGAVASAVTAFVLVYVLGFTGAAETTTDQPFRVEGGYVRSVGANAMAGGAYMVIHNQSGVDDRLVAVQTDVSDRAELHSHTEDANGVMMRPIKGGIAIPAGGQAVLQRGGDHVMMMGLHGERVDGTPVKIILTFQKAGDRVFDMAMDSSR